MNLLKRSLQLWTKIYGFCSFGFYSITTIGYLSTILNNNENKKELILALSLSSYFLSLLLIQFHYISSLRRFLKTTFMICLFNIIFHPICFGVLYNQIRNTFTSSNTELLYFNLYYISIACFYIWNCWKMYYIYYNYYQNEDKDWMMI
jgi:hypothetical protein